jgi:hypothetical protein
MKKSLMMVAAMMISSFIFAQHNPDKHKGEHSVDNMKTVLSLDDNQYATVQGIQKKYGSRYAELKKDSTMAKEKKRHAIKSLRSEQQKEIKAILTPDQKTKWDAYRAEQKTKRKAEKNKTREQHAIKMKETLSLSDDQFTKMQALNKDFSKKIKAEKKDGKKDKDAFKKLKEEHETAVKSILSDQQFEKWKSMKADRKSKHSHRDK